MQSLRPDNEEVYELPLKPASTRSFLKSSISSASSMQPIWRILLRISSGRDLLATICGHKSMNYEDIFLKVSAYFI